MAQKITKKTAQMIFKLLNCIPAVVRVDGSGGELAPAVVVARSLPAVPRRLPPPVLLGAHPQRGVHRRGAAAGGAAAAAAAPATPSDGVGVIRAAGGNCIKIGLPGKLILRDYFQENRTSQRPFLLLRISFPGRPILYNSSQEP